MTMPMPPVSLTGGTSGADRQESQSSNSAAGFNFGTYYGGGANSAKAVTNPWLNVALVGGAVVLGLAYLKSKK